MQLCSLNAMTSRMQEIWRVAKAREWRFRTKDKRDIIPELTFAERMGKLLTFTKMWNLTELCWHLCQKYWAHGFSSFSAWNCSWKLWCRWVGGRLAKVNYKQLHLAAKSIWGFNPILEQIAWKCKIDCLQIATRGGRRWGIKCRFCSKFRWCSTALHCHQFSSFPPRIQCNLFVILSLASFQTHFP